tara:strand:- start:1804 stop:2772 length:969 start_codon:yes stop_codon:yes gene_type:complete
MKNILITGITGQDGIFLTKNILSKEKNVNIVGISRATSNKQFFKNLSLINNERVNNVSLINIDLNNFSDISKFIKDFKPSVVYNLSGPSSPSESIKNREKYILIENIFNNLTKSLVDSKNLCNFFQASSSEMFEENIEIELDEQSSFSPNSPYAVFKYNNHQKINELKKKYDWKIYSGIMFNHESEFRGNGYLMMSLINSAIQISKGEKNYFNVGSLEYIRDWSFAGDVVEAIYRITNFGQSSNYVIGSGKGNSIKKMIEIIYTKFGLNYENFIQIDSGLLRPGDPIRIVSNPLLLNKELSWKAKLSFEELIDRCIRYKLKS